MKFEEANQAYIDAKNSAERQCALKLFIRNTDCTKCSHMDDCFVVKNVSGGISFCKFFRRQRTSR